MWSLVFLPCFYTMDMSALFLGIPHWSGFVLGYFIVFVAASLIAGLRLMSRRTTIFVGSGVLAMILAAQTTRLLLVQHRNYGLAEDVVRTAFNIGSPASLLIIAMLSASILSALLACSILSLKFVLEPRP